jgi:hypothetical protein
VLKLFPLKIPVESDIGARFKGEAERLGLSYWEFLGRLLKMWEQQAPNAQLSLFPQEESKPAPSSPTDQKIEELEAQLKMLQDMVSKMVTITAIPVVVEPAELGAVEQFKEAFNALEKDRHAVIADLRQKLGWSSEHFEAVLRQLRDEGAYQLQAGDTSALTAEQASGGFQDENGFKFLTVMRQPEKPRRGRSRKEKTEPLQAMPERPEKQNR